MVAHFFDLPEIARLRAGGRTNVANDGEAQDEQAGDLARSALRVMLYAAVGPEAPTKPLAERLMQASYTVCLPRLCRERPGHMDVVPVHDWQTLVPGPFFDIPQPAPDVEAVHPNTLDVIVVPAVGFDRQGRRLGQGGGYYDRLLAELPRRIIRIGWVFSVQMVEELPEEAHDRRVDVIVTEAGIVRPARERGLSP